jgi:hypothetical protein
MSALGEYNRGIRINLFETTLNGIKGLEEELKDRWDLDDTGENSKVEEGLTIFKAGMKNLNLKPRQIRTFIVNIEDIASNQELWKKFQN